MLPTLKGSLGMPLLLLLVAAGLWLSGSNTSVFLKLHTLMLQLGGPIWANLTMLGDAAVTPLFLVVFIRRRPDLLWAAVIGSLLAYGFSHGLKPLINEARPPAVLDIVVVGPRLLHGSFPSGHATTIFMLAGLLILGLPVRSRLFQLGIVLAATTVGLSRIGVGVHWPVDILIGGADGWIEAVDKNPAILARVRTACMATRKDLPADPVAALDESDPMSNQVMLAMNGQLEEEQ